MISVANNGLKSLKYQIKITRAVDQESLRVGLWI